MPKSCQRIVYQKLKISWLLEAKTNLIIDEFPAELLRLQKQYWYKHYQVTMISYCKANPTAIHVKL